MKPKRLLFFPTALLALVFATACGPRESRPVLHVFSWADYIAPEVIEAFEEAHRCRVVVDTFDSNESMYAKLRAGATGYDIIIPSSYFAEIMQAERLLAPIPRDLIPNLAHVDREFLDRFVIDRPMAYSVPYMVGTTGIGYRSDRVSDLEPSWFVFDNAEWRGRMMMLDDMRETLGAALKALGFSLNTVDPDEINQARDLVIRWKKQLAQFDSEAYKNTLASGSMLVAQGYSGDVRMVMDDAPAVRFILPEEGFSFFIDDLVIPQSAPSPELAAAFINFLHDPEIAAINMEWTYYRSPNLPAYDLLNPEVRNDPVIFITDEKLERAEMIKNVGEAIRLYQAAWDAVKSAR